MDNDRRLKRYRRKDYGELVGFPVEIVGRDGVVRCYDFAESVRLYERRMVAAAERYSDADLISAEQGHCRSRIDQLRRSFFHLSGWTNETGGPDGQHPDQAGELAGFLARVFRVSGRLSVGFRQLPATPGLQAEVWYVTRRGRSAGFLLYCYWPEVHRVDAARVEAQRMVHALHAASATGEAERLVGRHEGFDCAFILTARAMDVMDLVEVGPDELASGFEPTPWDEIADLMHKGDLPSALVRARWVVREQPWHRDAYVAGAVAAMALRRPEDAEDLAFVGTGYLPADGLLRFHLAQARLSMGRVDEAVVELRRALEVAPRLVAARSLLVVLLLLSGRVVAGLGIIRTPGGEEASADLQAHEAVTSIVVRSGWLLVAIAVAVTLSAVATVVGGVAGVVALTLALMAGTAGVRSVGSELTWLASRHGADSVERAMARLATAGDVEPPRDQG
jgi:hypothetical protein